MNIIIEARTEDSHRNCKRVVNFSNLIRKEIFGWLDNEYKIKKIFFI